jgi:pimeloyl-ACP methyl ester carboxylesterase
LAIVAGLALVLLGGLFVAAQGTSHPASAAAGSRDGVAPLLARAVASEGASATAPLAPARPVPLVTPGSDLIIGDYFVHIPNSIEGRLEVLVALHGMGGQGAAFCNPILNRTDRERWVVVAPTHAYGDWRDPGQVAREESARFIPRLHEFLTELPARTGLDLEPRVALYGFSRGGQLAQRYAMVYPEKTQGVATLSAGTYTLPQTTAEIEGRTVSLPYPFGTADLRERYGRELNVSALRQVPFWVGVGAEDRNPADLPRQWDPYLGDTRVGRAEAFVRRVNEVGANAQLALFPGVGHGLTEPMVAQALDFIAALP